MFYKHAYLNILLLLHSAFMLCVVKMPLKGKVGDSALNSQENYIVDYGNLWKIHGIMLLNFYGNPVDSCIYSSALHTRFYHSSQYCDS